MLPVKSLAALVASLITFLALLNAPPVTVSNPALITLPTSFFIPLTVSIVVLNALAGVDTIVFKTSGTLSNIDSELVFIACASNEPLPASIEACLKSHKLGPPGVSVPYISTNGS